MWQLMLGLKPAPRYSVGTLQGTGTGKGHRRGNTAISAHYFRTQNTSTAFFIGAGIDRKSLVRMGYAVSGIVSFLIVGVS
mgnify:CR=1 FL=1